MSTTVSISNCHNDDEIDDNTLNEEECFEDIANVAIKYPEIPRDGTYYRPIEFCSKRVYYGDGGELDLDYPIWICGGLSEHVSDLETNIREELLEVFYTLNEKRKDFHDYPSPVEDIIDPDLLVCKPIEPPPPLRLLPNSNDEYFQEVDDEDFQEEDDWNPFYDKQWNVNPSTLRRSYQWIPSEFRICHGNNDDYQVHIETPISHLPMTEEYEKTYRNLEKLFTKLVPMFGEILCFNKDKADIRLQVIVKVQSYHIQPGIKYTGRWHTEGCTENIQAVGVHYLYIDDELEGGALKFRPAEAPAENYAEISKIDVNRYIMPETDAAIVFDNCLPHRFCSIRNSTSIARRRTFLNFFIVSPHNPIYGLSISNLPLVSYKQCWTLLKNIQNGNHQQQFPDLVTEKILSFLKKYMWETDTDAKEFRSYVRHEMASEYSGWLGIHYGNNGDVMFIKSNHDWKIRKNKFVGIGVGNYNIPTLSDD